MNKKKVLTLMAMLTVAAMVTACGGKKEEAAVTESEAVESTVVESVENTDTTESTELIIEDDSEVALAESVEKTEEEMSVVEYNAEFLGNYIDYGEQAIEVAEALEILGFGKYKEVIGSFNTRLVIADEEGMVVSLHYTLAGEYYDRIDTEDEETTLWEWEYTDKYEIEWLVALYGEGYKTGFKLVYPENTEKSIVEENTNILGMYIFNSEQAIEVAEALDDIGFGMCVETYNNIDYLQIIDEKGMVLDLFYKNGTVPKHSYFVSILSEDWKHRLWEQE